MAISHRRRHPSSSTSPPAGSTFLGWTNAPIADSNGASLARVSNPNYGAQVFSTHEVDTNTSTCQGLPRGEFIYSDDVFGATEGGVDPPLELVSRRHQKWSAIQGSGPVKIEPAQR